MCAQNIKIKFKLRHFEFWQPFLMHFLDDEKCLLVDFRRIFENKLENPPSWTVPP
jgi:hypothetical protein